MNIFKWVKRYLFLYLVAFMVLSYNQLDKPFTISIMGAIFALMIPMLRLPENDDPYNEEPEGENDHEEP